MKDYTGKSGVGKRYLDETTGTLIPISTLPKEKQLEIAENSRKVALAARKHKIDEMAGNYNIGKSDDKLLSIVEKQATIIDRLEERLNQLEARDFTSISEKQLKEYETEEGDEVDEFEEEVKLTPKEELLAQAMDLGIEVDPKMTMKTIKTLIDAARGEVELVEEKEVDEEDNSDL